MNFTGYALGYLYNGRTKRNALDGGAVLAVIFLFTVFQLSQMPVITQHLQKILPPIVVPRVQRVGLGRKGCPGVVCEAERRYNTRFEWRQQRLILSITDPGAPAGEYAQTVTQQQERVAVQ